MGRELLRKCSCVRMRSHVMIWDMVNPPAPIPPPEAQLIEQKRNQPPRMSIRQAAARAGISETRWRQIESGARIFRGNRYPERAPAGTLASMARVVGVTPGELANAGRQDAADELAVMGPLTATNPARRSRAEQLASMEELVRELRAQDQEEENNDDDGKPPGTTGTG